ncbi:MAG: dihydrolipoyllysine-residue acetyltransferase [Burkholderiales bacterium]|nr:dihydrolipoyllysine-residue acetyltransferase [Burkholderiales bacterium]
MSNLVELKVPDIGTDDKVSVAEIYVKVGDSISIDDNLIMLETDKASMDVPASESGIVKEIYVKVGSKVSQGDVIIKVEAATSPTTAAKTDTVPAKTAVAETVAPKNINNSNSSNTKTNTTTNDDEAIDEDSFSRAIASPSIRKLARELGVDLSLLKGSGSKGRVTEADVKSFVKGIISGETLNVLPTVVNNVGGGLNLLPWPKIDFAKFGEVEVKPQSRIKKISAANLARNWAMIPHVTQFDDADITGLEEFRCELNEEYKKDGIKISPLAFLIKASVFALKKFPQFNTSLDGDNLIYKKYFNIGFAADTPHGLVVPVLKDAHRKGIVEIAAETSALAKLAREGKLMPTDMQGGSFTISSLGGIGGTAFTPIINAPEVAILGISKSSIKPWWNGKEFVPRLIMPLSLSYDHRVIDGALAAKFTTYLANILADVRRLIL